MKYILLVLNDKGGVGKTIVCSSLVELALAQQWAFTLFDFDRSNPDVRAAYHERTNCRLALFSEAEHFQDIPNSSFLAVKKGQPVIGNLPAQVQPALFQWFKDNEILEIAAEEEVEFYLIHVTDGEFESVNIMTQYLNFFEDRVKHFVVKNLGKSENWQYFQQHTELQQYIEAYQIPIIDFPKFHGIKELKFIRDNRLSFSAALEHQSFNSISRRRVSRFLKETSACFEPLYPIFHDGVDLDSKLA